MVHFLHVVASSSISIRRSSFGAVSASISALVEGIIETSAASAFRPAASSASRTAPISSGGVDVDGAVVIGHHVFCACFQRRFHDSVFIAFLEGDNAFLAEQVGDGTVGAEVTPVLVKA